MIHEPEDRPGTGLTVVQAGTARVRDVQSRLPANADFVVIESAPGRRALYRASAIRNAAGGDPDALFERILPAVPRERLFVLDTLPANAREWGSVATDLVESGAPGVVVNWATARPVFFTARDVLARGVSPAGGGGGGGGGGVTFAFERTRQYICRKCAPPTSRRPGSGGAPVCPSDPAHGTMSPA